MVEVENVKVLTAANHPGCTKIRQAAGLPAALVFQMALMVRELERAQGAFNQARAALLRTFATKDENGEPVHNGVQFLFGEPENEAAFKEEYQHLLEAKVTLMADPVCVDLKAIHEYQGKHSMTPLTLTPDEMATIMMLDPIFRVVLPDGAGG